MLLTEQIPISPLETFHNLIAVKQRIGNKIRNECIAKYYLEPISEFAFCTQSDPSLIETKIVSDAYEITKIFHQVIILSTISCCSALLRRR